MGGTWGAYPYFKSGLIIHGDRDLGMFIMDPAPHLKQGTTSARETGGLLPPLAVTGWRDGALHFQLPRAGGYVLSIYTPAGREIFRHRDRGLSGSQSLLLDGGLLSGGAYLAQLRQDAQSFAAPIAPDR
jgi:hypothetical protein